MRTDETTSATNPINKTNFCPKIGLSTLTQCNFAFYHNIIPFRVENNYFLRIFLKRIKCQYLCMRQVEITGGVFLIRAHISRKSTRQNQILLPHASWKSTKSSITNHSKWFETIAKKNNPHEFAVLLLLNDYGEWQQKQKQTECAWKKGKIHLHRIHTDSKAYYICFCFPDKSKIRSAMQTMWVALFLYQCEHGTVDGEWGIFMLLKYSFSFLFFR